MKCLPDHHTAHRIATLRRMQGLPFAIPAGHTVYRQSDFEKSKVWRYVMIAGFIVAINALFEKAPAEPKPSLPAAHASGTARIVASGVPSFQSQYTTQSSSISSDNQFGNGKNDGRFQSRLRTCRPLANSSNCSLT